MVLAGEGLLALGVAGWQLLGLSQGQAGRPEVAWGSSTYFLLLAAIVAGFAFASARGARWVYGPAVFLQVLGLPLAVTMAVEGLWVGAAVLGGLSATGVALLISERGRQAYGRDTLGLQQ